MICADGLMGCFASYLPLGFRHVRPRDGPVSARDDASSGWRFVHVVLRRFCSKVVWYIHFFVGSRFCFFLPNRTLLEVRKVCASIFRLCLLVESDPPCSFSLYALRLQTVLSHRFVYTPNHFLPSGTKTHTMSR